MFGNPLKNPLCLLALLCTLPAFSEGTRTWEQSSFDELSKGTAHGVAIQRAGGLELAPAYKPLFTTQSAYIWSIAADLQGNLYAAAGAPARVYRITPDGQSTPIFEPKELQVQTLVVDKNGIIYAATNPDGKVYKIEHRLGAAMSSKSTDAKSGPATAEWNVTVYFDPATKYIWGLVLDEIGSLFVATGDHGEIFRVTPKGEHSAFFTSDEAHIRVLALDSKGNLVAGSDGSGLVYRIAPDGKAFVLYSAPKKEITALALDKAGNIYVAGAGEKHPAAAPTSLPLTPAPSSGLGHGPGQQSGIMITSMTPMSPLPGGFPAPGTGVAGGSEIYRITPDGSPARIWQSREDLVYALAFDKDARLLAGTGNRGHIFAVTREDDFVDLLKASATQVTAFAPGPGGALYAATSNLGKVFSLGAAPEAEGSYESDVFDAHTFSRWGRAEYRGQGNVDLFARSGNVDNPDRNWSTWEKVDLRKGAQISAPSARFIQWKAVLHSGNPAPHLDSVTLNYLPKNVAPDFDDITVQPGVRYQPLPKSPNSDSGSMSGGQSQIHFEVPIPTVHDRDVIGVKWDVHDENDDQMVYSVYYRGDGETRWLLLKDKITDKSYSFDASLLPDGGYTIKVIASDAPSHSPGEALSAEKESDRFEVDTTPPQIEGLKASVEGGGVRVTFQAVDGFSPMKRAEFSVDAGPWQYVEPRDKISDSKAESYDFRIAGITEEPEHVVVVRAYDRYDNMSSAKTVIRTK